MSMGPTMDNEALSPLQQRRLDVVEQFSSLFGYYISKPPSVTASANGANGVLPYSSLRGNNGGSNGSGSGSGSCSGSSSTSHTAASLIAERKSRGVYGANNQMNALSPSSHFLTLAMDPYLYKDDADPIIGGAIISVPALELQSPVGSATANNRDANGATASNNNNASTNVVLPSLGQSSRNTNGNNNGSSLGQNQTNTKTFIPAMVASVLGNHDDVDSQIPISFASPTKQSANPSIHTLTRPNLTTTSDDSLSAKSKGDTLQEANATATGVEYAAAKNLGRLVSYTRSSAPHSPGTMTRTLFESFTSLVQSRVKAWTLLLLRHSLSSGDEDSRARLMSLLASNTIELSDMVTTVRVEKAEKEEKKEEDREHKAENIGEAQDQKADESSSSQNATSKPCDVTVPLSLEIDIDIALQERVISVHIEASGTAHATFHQNTALLTLFKVELNANNLVTEMIAQARLVVLQAVAQATSNSSNLQRFPQEELSLSKFGSSLSLTAGSTQNGTNSQNSHMSSYFNSQQPRSSTSASRSLLKSGLKPSALHISSSRSPSSDKNNRKRDRERSVTWDSSVNNLKSVFKKPKKMNSLKRSIKSFGKPNSDFFESAKNATFAEFGNLTNNPNVPKISNNGRLEVPKGGVHHLSTMNLTSRHTLDRGGVAGGRNMNASFDLAQTPSLVPALSSQLLKKKPTFTELARNAKYSQAPPQPMNSFLSFDKMFAKGKSEGLKRTPTQLEGILLAQTQTKTTNSGGNASWK